MAQFTYHDVSAKFGAELDKTVAAMTTRGKGLLAADESTSTIKKRFDSANIENTEENRRAYRELLFLTAKESHQYISGVIMFEETLYQKTKDGTPFVKLLADHGIVPGIKVDHGLKEILGTYGDYYTEGVCGLGDRCKKYYEAGARFTKWRAAFNVNPAKGMPSDLAIQINADLLARYAAISQANGLVPIVEPEVLVMDGDHSIEVSFAVTEKILAATFKALADHHVALERMILKPNMVLPGDKAGKASPQVVGEQTVKLLRRVVPPAVPGIMFLSGGQGEEEATINLDAVNKAAQKVRTPWELSFSYGRALQSSAIKTWKGSADNVPAAQAAYLLRAKNNFLAAQGKYN